MNYYTKRERGRGVGGKWLYIHCPLHFVCGFAHYLSLFPLFVLGEEELEENSPKTSSGYLKMNHNGKGAAPPNTREKEEWRRGEEGAMTGD